jgi:ADP-dependent NAD(P)H-hydrate dehydratase / NAD(P)H-hydrate epimerase
VCAHYDGSWFINTSGNVGLASGGTGDVLSGIIGSLMAQGLSGLQAAKLSVYVHGAAADALVEKGVGPIGLTASEVALEARNIINLLNKKTD